jgi:hypothetical protein
MTLEPLLLLAVLQSGGDPGAESDAGAKADAEAEPLAVPPPPRPSPPPSPPPPPPPRPVAQVTEARQGHELTMSAAAGCTPFAIHDIAAVGGEGIITFGGMTKNLGWSIEGSYLGGSTRNGLLVQRFAVGPSLEGRAGRLGLGGGFFHATMWIARASNGPDLTFGFSGLGVHASYDLVASSHNALFVGARLFWGATGGANLALYGGGLFLGWRFRG